MQYKATYYIPHSVMIKANSQAEAETMLEKIVATLDKVDLSEQGYKLELIVDNNLPLKQYYCFYQDYSGYMDGKVITATCPQEIENKRWTLLPECQHLRNICENTPELVGAIHRSFWD